MDRGLHPVAIVISAAIQVADQPAIRGSGGDLAPGSLPCAEERPELIILILV